MATILVIDDEPSICWGLSELGKRMQHQAVTASSAEQGLALAEQYTPDLVLLDVRLPGMDGLSALPHLQKLAPQAPVVVMTAHGDLNTTVEAVRLGAFDYVAKPFDLDQIQRVIEKSLAEPPSPAESTTVGTSADGLVGRTPAMQEVFKRTALVAPSNACVMLSGESGTGKELIARAIHRYSRRHDQPLVVVNVAALNPALAESELFGHTRGAFTGAEQARSGLLQQADGGTLFLDEVAEIPLPIQVKLLRVLELGEFTPVGSNQPQHTNLRLITATHQNLQAKVQAGEFRHDLYYRLATFEIALPALRERREDIPLLASHFLHQFLADASSAPTKIAQSAIDELLSRNWHGNVRELRNALEHALILAREGLILPEHLPAPLPMIQAQTHLPAPSTMPGLSPSPSLQDQIQQWTSQRLSSGESPTDLYNELLALVEPPFLSTSLNKHRGQCASAARTLGLHRTTLKKKLDQYGIAGDD